MGLFGALKETKRYNAVKNKNFQSFGHTCSAVHRTKWLVHQYLLSLKMDHLGVILFTEDLGGPSDQSGPFSQ